MFANHAGPCLCGCEQTRELGSAHCSVVNSRFSRLTINNFTEASTVRLIGNRAPTRVPPAFKQHQVRFRLESRGHTRPVDVLLETSLRRPTWALR